MSVNIGEAVGYLDLDTSRFRSGFQSALGDLRQFRTDSESVMNSLKTTTGAAFTSVGTNLTNLITKPALVAGGALAGITLGKGWSRMTQLDTAKAKLEALGNSAKDVALISKNVGNVVEGTAYTSAQAMTVAASAVAAGIKPGKELERYLSLIGDAAAVAGTDMSEMGNIFNKVTATGKATAETMNQLAERGIPIWSLLAKATGQSMDDLRAAVSAGKVSIEDLQSAIEIGMGGAARTIGSKTISGALTNLWAYVGKLGQSFLGASDDASSFAGQLLPILNDLIQKVQDLGPKAEELGKKFGSTFTTIVKVLTKMPTGLIAFTGALAVSAGPVLKFSGKVIDARNKLNAFKIASEGASASTGILSGNLTISQAILGNFGNKVNSAFRGLKTGFSSLTVESAKNTASNMLNAASQSRVASGATKAASSVLAFAGAHKVALAATLGVLGPIALMIGYMVKTGTSAEEMAQKITDVSNQIAEKITSFSEELPTIINSFTTAFPTMITALLGAIPALIPVVIDAGTQLFMSFVEALAQIAEPLTAALPSVIEAVVTGIVTLAPAIVQAGITIFSALIQAIPQVIPVIVKSLPQIILAIVTGLLQFGSALVDVGSDLFKSLWQGMKTYGPILASNVIAWAKSLPGKIASGLGSLWSIGADWIQGLWNGLASKFNSVISWAERQIAKLPKAFKKILGIGSPSKISRSDGVFWIEGLRLGLLDKTSSLMNTAKNQVKQLMRVYSGAAIGIAPSLETATTGAVGTATAKSSQFDFDRFSRIVETNNEALSETIYDAVTEAMKSFTLKIGEREFGRVVREVR